MFIVFSALMFLFSCFSIFLSVYMKGYSFESRMIKAFLIAQAFVQAFVGLFLCGAININ